ncbi:hypothetical protein [Streptomyces sp. 2314.4]|uniref:nSTAND3 domain-containing NTPase n=1 Tax=Streptomyces sp. 2314.4 TaxID=1881025 RepID=UPI000A4B5C6A|nr:hypothetical protein [Streptomyces sp. 2314.4]
MNDPFTTRVELPSGGVHTGPGNIYNNHHYNTGPLKQETAGRSPRRIADDQLRLLRQRFVDPEGMGEARRLLAEHSTVILHGAPGSGRTAAARVLLYELHRDTGIFRELLSDGGEEADLTDAGLVGAGDRLLLDLAEADGTQWAKNHRDLSVLRKAVHEQQAHLVVVMPHERTLESDLQIYRAEISQPPAGSVPAPPTTPPDTARGIPAIRARICGFPGRAAFNRRDRGLRGPRAAGPYGASDARHFRRMV